MTYRHLIPILLLPILTGCNPFQQRPKLVYDAGQADLITGLSWMPDSQHLIVKLMRDEYDSRAVVAPLAGGSLRGLGQCLRLVDPQPTADGRKVLLTDPDGSLVFRSVADGKGYTITVRDQRADMTDAALAPDGKRIAIAQVMEGHEGLTATSRLRMIDLVGKVLREKTYTGGMLGIVIWSPDSRFLMLIQYSFDAKRVTIADGSSLKTVQAFTIPFDWRVSRQCWGPDSKRFFGLGAPDAGKRSIWMAGTSSKQITDVFQAPTNQGGEAAWSPDGKTIALSDTTIPADGKIVTTIYLIDIESGDIKKHFGPLEGEVGWLMWSPSGDALAFVRLNRVEVLRVQPSKPETARPSSTSGIPAAS